VYGTDTRLSDSRTATAHAASHQSGGADSIALDTLAVPTDITTLNATTSAHGLLPKLGGGTTNFFRADGTYAALPANSTTVAGTVAASPNNTNKVYVGDSSWSFLPQQTETNGTFVVPAAGSTVAVTIVSAAWPVVGQTVWISDGTRVGFFEITVVTSATSITVKNQGYLGNSVSGTMATGSIVKLVGPNVATSTKPGFVPTPPNDATKFLDGTAAFSVVNYNNLSNLPTLGTSAAKDIPASGNASSTQVVYGSDTRLSDARTPTAHATSHKSGGSDSIKLDELAATTDITTLNASATAHGLLPKLSNVSTQYLDGTGAWSTPAGGGGSSGPPKPFKTWVAGLEGYTPSTLYATFGVRNNRPHLAFNDSATWTAYLMTVIPTGADLTSGLVVRTKWMAATATTGNVMWGVSIERMNTDMDADSFATQTTATTATSATSGILVETAITVSAANCDGAVAGDGIIVQLQRVGGNAADTATGDVQASLVTVETVV
jgi:hypothetical protein